MLIAEIHAILYILAHVLLLLMVFYYLLPLIGAKGKKTVVPISSSVRAAEELCKVLRDRMGRDDFTLVDLGCGTGVVVRHVARSFPQARVIGLDHNPQVLFLARLRSRLGLGRYKNLKFVRADLWKTDLAGLGADVVYSYFGTQGAARLGAKMAAELGAGTLVISNKFELAGLRQIGRADFKTLLNGPLYIYQINPCNNK